MHFDGRNLVFSPHDLVAFLEGTFPAWMDRFLFEVEAGTVQASAISVLGIKADDLAPDEEGEEAEIIKRKGFEHENRFLQSVIAKHPDLITIQEPGNLVAKTMVAMRSGPSVIYQGHLGADAFRGVPDFLFRVPGRSQFGEFHYEPWDTKLAKSAKPHFIVQLCAYAEMLATLQGRLPANFTFVLGGANEPKAFRVEDFIYYFRHLKRAFSEFHRDFDPQRPPFPTSAGAAGRWSGIACQILESSDHLSRVARITSSQVQRLTDAGITTLTQLAQIQQCTVPRMAPETFARLKGQATAQFHSKGKDKPIVEVMLAPAERPRWGLASLPPASGHDVFFDMEGFPLIEGGLEYLFGAVHFEDGRSSFADWWAHDEVQERTAFEQFVDWAHDRWKQDPSMHIYHYAAYECTALRRLMGKYASREAKVEDLLRNKVFVDLYTVIRQGLVIGTAGYSLKDIECLYMGPRTGAVMTAGGSIVAYQHWLDRGESPDWQQSAILREIRDYNRVDCESLVGLRDWLLNLRTAHAIDHVPEPVTGAATDKGDGEKEQRAATILALRLLEPLRSDAITDIEVRRVQELIAWLLEFHWREAKPAWWRMFDRHEMTEQELFDDLGCLAGLERTENPPQPEKKSLLYEYRFDPDQDTKICAGDRCYFAHDLSVTREVFDLDTEAGLVTIKIVKTAPQPPQRLNLIPNEIVSAAPIAAAVRRYAEAWAQGSCVSPAVDDLLHRRPPRIKQHTSGALIRPAADSVPQIVQLVQRMDGTTLCIQGPPGTGKTHACGAIIAELLKQRKTIGVTANSHKAILNVLRMVAEAVDREKVPATLYKVGKDDDPLVQNGTIASIEPADAASAADGPAAIGGTAWVLSCPELQQKFDYLFIDEAGQFSLANAVAVGLSATNLVMVGDQMQLSQPIQGTHPGESGMSALDYLLNGRATIPDDFGIFLGQTRRLHPDICDFISAAVYENRLTSHDSTRQRRLVVPAGAKLVVKPTGISFVPVYHEGNTQCSDEEVTTIKTLVQELLLCGLATADGERNLTLDDILFVVPYNMQVRRLQDAFGANARVGTVDRFQGQEAPVVIVSMSTSSLDDCPRGAEFLLNQNRLNVAVSRAQCLALVVGSPRIAATRCTTVEQMKLVNLFCRLMDYSQTSQTSRPEVQG